MTWLGHCMPNEKISLSMSLNSRPFLVPIFELPDFSEQLAEYIPCSGTRLYIYIPILSCSPLRMHMINTFCVCIFYIHTNIHTSIHPGHTYIRTKNLIYHPVTQYGVLENPAPQALGHNDLATSNLSQLWLWVVLRCYCVCEVAFLLIFIRMVTFVELN